MSKKPKNTLKEDKNWIDYRKDSTVLSSSEKLIIRLFRFLSKDHNYKYIIGLIIGVVIAFLGFK